MRVSCALVVVICLCVALRAHVGLSGIGIGSCHPSVAACRPGTSDMSSCLSTPAVLPARAVTIPCPTSAFCSYIRVCLPYGSCLTPARPHASDCSRFIVAVLPAHVVISSAEHCGMAVLPAFAIASFSIPSVALHLLKVIASCTVLSAQMFQFPECSCSLRQASAYTGSLLLRLSQA